MTIGSPPAATAPAVPRAFQAIDDLGPVRLVAAVPRARRAGYSTGLLAAWAVSIFIGGFVVALFAQIAFEFEDDVFLVIAGVLWVVGLAIVLGWLRRKGAQVIVLYDRGIAVSDGRKVRRWRWEDIESVERRPIVSEFKPEAPVDLASAATVVAALAVFRLTKRPYVRVDSYYWFFDRTGGSFTLDRWLPAVDDLAETIDLQVTERLAPGARAALGDGRPVAFGQVTLSADSLAVGGTAVALAAIDRLEVDKDLVHIVAGGERRVAVPVAAIANLTLLLQLFDELRGARSG